MAADRQTDTCIIIGLTNGSHTVELCSSNGLFYHTLLTRRVKDTFMRSPCCVCGGEREGGGGECPPSPPHFSFSTNWPNFRKLILTYATTGHLLGPEAARSKA